MHSHEDKVRMIEFYLRCNRRAAAVIKEPDYPNRQTLRLRYRKFEENKKATFKRLTMGRPPTEIDSAAHRKQRTRPLRGINQTLASPTHSATSPASTVAIPMQRPYPRQQPQPTQQAVSRANNPKATSNQQAITSLRS